MASPSLTSDGLLALILAERRKDVDAVPPGFLTTEQWAKKWGIERTRATDLLSYAVSKGHAERKTFRVMCGIKRCPVAHFKQTKKGR